MKEYFIQTIKNLKKKINVKENFLMTYRSGGQTFCGDWLFSEILSNFKFGKNKAFIFLKELNNDKIISIIISFIFKWWPI